MRDDVLDTKLEAIVVDPIYESDGCQLSIDDIKKIKAAFKESGYIYAPPVYHKIQALNNSDVFRDKLDRSLKQIVFRFGWITEADNWQQAVEDIKQVFKANGYVPYDSFFAAYRPQDHLNGQEWYRRLAKHLGTYEFTTDEKDTILQAAFEVSEGLDV